jgi:hypothetical protein
MRTGAKLVFLILIFNVIYLNHARAQVSASANATVSLIAPLTLTKIIDMNFGNVAVGTSPGTVILSPSGTREATGGVTLPVNTGSVAAASFTVTGATNYTFSISLPPSTVTLKSGSNSLTVGVFTSSPATTGTLTGGTATLNVGATLTVPAGQAAGVYTTETPFTVTVNYN